MAAVSQAVAELERDHDQLHPFQCLCRDGSRELRLAVGLTPYVGHRRDLTGVEGVRHLIPFFLINDHSQG